MNEQQLLAMLVAVFSVAANAKEVKAKLTARCLACIAGGKANQVSVTIEGPEGLPMGQIALTIDGKEYILTSDGSNSMYITNQKKTLQGFNALVLALYKQEENADGEKSVKVDGITSTKAQVAAAAAVKASPLASSM